MIKVIALDERLVDLLVDIVTDHRKDVESGATTYGDDGEALHDLNEIMTALRVAEYVPNGR